MVSLVGSSQVSNRDLNRSRVMKQNYWEKNNQHLQVLVSTHLKRCKMMISGAGFKEGIMQNCGGGNDDEKLWFSFAFFVLKWWFIPETNSSHLKMNGRNTSFLLGWPSFRCEMLVLGSVFPRECQRDFHIIGNQPTSFTWHTPTKFAVCLPVKTITKKNTSG